MAVTISVNNAAQLATAIRTALGGETILLAPGNYGNVNITGRDYAASVTLKSADPSQEAEFNELRIDRSSNVFVNQVDIGRALQPGEAPWTQLAYVSNSHDLSFVNVDFHGSMDNNAWNDGWGLRFSYVQNVSVVNSTFKQLNIGISTEHSSNLVFTGNTVSEVREGFDFAASHNVTLAGNSFTAFQPWLANGDHPDAIQVLNYGYNEGSSNFLIRDNVILQGKNGTQGIHIRAEDQNPAYRHSDFVIENNLYSGASRIGIDVNDVDRVTVRNNTVTTSPAGNPGWDAAILLTNTTSALVERNITPLILQNGDRDTVLHDNVKLWDMAYRVGAPMADVFVNPGGSLYDAGNFAVRPGSVGAHAGFTLPPSTAEQLLAAFDGLRYLASNFDVALVYGTDIEAARQHYINSGISEGRSVTSFDPWLYAASNVDLAAAYGLDGQALSTHYIIAGHAENRAIASFDPYVYGASNLDVADAYGGDPYAMTQHWLVAGRIEGRGISFDPFIYAASNLDLAQRIGLDSHALAEHYVTEGRAEGRPTASFDALRYGASNSDLAAAFGADATALARHYVGWGQYENRALTGFDAVAYGATNRDLAVAYGTDEQGLLHHYLATGQHENRALTGFDAVAYLLSSADLGSLGLGADGALHHWLVDGAREGRVGDDLYGREQTNHALVVGTPLTDTIATAADRDWFQVELLSNQNIDFSVGAAPNSGFLAPRLEVSDAAGHLLANVFDTDGDALLHFAAPTDGLYYVSIAASQVGSYQLSALIG